MSGHNKWSQIKHKKAKTDGAKSKLYSKYSKLISAEAQKVNGDRTSASLRALIDRAKAEDVTNDVIERAIKKASEPGTTLEYILYESYGPGGCALMIEALTQNKNKAAQEVKHILSDNGFSLATPGSASWAFTREGSIWKPSMTIDLSDEDLIVLEKLVGDLENNEEVQDVFTNVE
ncbi:MAG: YebC/PmpR family DNA-binding transcriptional regulator [Candidatus Taylorbacteria bacterium CG10_big_fil_rev_8_21_14_0_10_41_48]|uniref:YebC/PmpR family DNA-binding transcriptional regulator n=1 Tax=Candidatus Taylorbacteria bacterium CG10_big_fil_rev_8_21_14_0_10_41_48 TaxID=1975024 RepID=A0A2M8LD40_9BACT|nr:MAG: YebC/PmpR family DNA-binding transcriptional regulator [Candidatus Taylorbacteria bacterium CG10_big_fil_rev_8_21_14_0_10_41_48]